MYCTCHIVPKAALKRFAEDRSMPAEQRKYFADTMKIDNEFRKLRTQANKLTRVAAAAITVLNCNQGQTLPGAQVANPTSSPDGTAKRAFIETSSVAAFYSQVF